MLDVRALVVTPGAGPATLGVPGAIATNDGAATPGVPLLADPGKAILRMWGAHSPAADSIGRIRLISQDQMDSQNGIDVALGAASLLCQFYDYTRLPFKTGVRNIQVSTNVGVVAGYSFMIDEYEAGACQEGDTTQGGEVMVGGMTFGGALTTNVWGSVAFNPTNAIPAGKYIILGAYVSALTNGGLIRFAHADFKGFKPGFPVGNFELGLVATEQVLMRDELVRTAHGEQFVYLSKIFGKKMCPEFNAGPGATGLSIEMMTVAADTPVVNLVLARVG